jgi:hypothetical protein
MADGDDIERKLRDLRFDLDPRTRESVMHAFRDLREDPRPSRRVSWWRRPVPLYLAACFAVVIAGLTFAIGSRAATSRVSLTDGDRTAVADSSSIPDFTWIAVARDQL